MNKLQVDRGLGLPKCASFNFEGIVKTSEYEPWLNWLS